MRIIPRSNLPQTRNNIIQKGLAFGREQSGTVTVPGAVRPRDRAPPAAWPRRGCGGGGNDAAPTQWRIPMARLTDMQLVILSTLGSATIAESTCRHVEAVRKAVDRLIRTGLLEEVRANGSFLTWRRDAEAGPMALRITKDSLQAIDAGEEWRVGSESRASHVTGFWWYTSLPGTG